MLFNGLHQQHEVLGGVYSTQQMYISLRLRIDSLLVRQSLHLIGSNLISHQIHQTRSSLKHDKMPSTQNHCLSTSAFAHRSENPNTCAQTKRKKGREKEILNGVQKNHLAPIGFQWSREEDEEEDHLIDKALMIK